MLNDSNSPLTALEHLLQWQALPETKEVLNLLNDKADLAEIMVKATPLAYRDDKSGTVLPGDTITQLRNNFIGEEKGLRHLSVVLAQRENELREIIKKQDETKS